MPSSLATAVVNLGAPLTDLDEGETLAIAPASRGFVVVSGHLSGRVDVYGGTGIELVGHGDVVLLDRRGSDASGAPTAATRWTAIDSAQVAWLQDASWGAMLRHPAWSRALIESQAQRVEHLRSMQAASTLTRVDDRILGAMWLLAERFGQVTPEGTLVGIPLAHRLIGELIGARRPTVTTAVSKLAAEGLLSRSRRGRWVLHGSPPQAPATDAAIHSLAG
ncbi:MAG TPA: Crp/Fnr family transcriptional regulator [Capillimicrobium sp.]|nr:Crp/Fnr family transcriptional regulator [Capillimicrobium sp.]